MCVLYALVYGDDVDGIGDDSIPKHDASDTPYHIVSATPLRLRCSEYSLKLTEPRHANEIEAEGCFSGRENRRQ